MKSESMLVKHLASLTASLSDKEIDEICGGLTQNCAKVRYLERLGLSVRQKPNGKPLVSRACYEHWKSHTSTQPKINTDEQREILKHIKPVSRELNEGLQQWQADRRATAGMREAENKKWLGSKERSRLTASMKETAKTKRASIVRHHSAKRRAAKLTQSPPWADHEKIKAVYQLAQELTKSTGVPHHVDHIIPLTGEAVRGLHVHTNLQVITATENIRKHNKFEVEQ